MLVCTIAFRSDVTYPAEAGPTNSISSRDVKQYPVGSSPYSYAVVGMMPLQGLNPYDASDRYGSGTYPIRDGSFAFSIAAAGRYDDVFRETASTTHAILANDSYFWSSSSLNPMDTFGRYKGAHFYFYPAHADCTTKSAGTACGPGAMGFSPSERIHLEMPAPVPSPPPSSSATFETVLPPYMCHVDCPQRINDNGKDVITLEDAWRLADNGTVQYEEKNVTDCMTTGPGTRAGDLFDNDVYTQGYTVGGNAGPPHDVSTRWFQFRNAAGTHLNEHWTPRAEMCVAIINNTNIAAPIIFPTCTALTNAGIHPGFVMHIHSVACRHRTLWFVGMQIASGVMQSRSAHVSTLELTPRYSLINCRGQIRALLPPPHQILLHLTLGV